VGNTAKSSRRNFVKTGIGSMGALIAAKSLADTCISKPTGEQPLGPFFPNPGTPTLPVRENPDPNTPIYLANDNDLTFVQGNSGLANGQAVYVKGIVADKNCNPIPNANIIIWQASHSGRYNHNGDDANTDFRHPETGELIRRKIDPSFQYWGRTQSNELGEYQFKTVVPGFYPASLQDKWYRPPHIHFLVSATGFQQLVTQLYFSGEALNDSDWISKLNEKDYLLQSPDLSEEERNRLVVNFEADSKKLALNELVGNFDITLKR